MRSFKGGKLGAKVHVLAICVALALFLLPQALLAATNWELRTPIPSSTTDTTVYGRVYVDSPTIVDKVYANVYSGATASDADWKVVTSLGSGVAVDTQVYYDWNLAGLTLNSNTTYTVLGQAYDGNTCISEAKINTFTIGGNSNNSGGGGGGTVTSTTSVSITASKGGTVSISGASVSVPASALSKDFNVKIEKLTGSTGLSFASTQKLISSVFEFTKDVSGDFLKPVTIALSFDKSNIDTDMYDIVICWYNTTSREWVELDNQSISLSSSRASGEVDHFTKFAVLAVEKEDVVEPPTTEVTLTDITGHWAKNSIDRLVKMGAITGYPDNTFKPDNAITRAEFATVLVKALNLSQTSGKVFDDTSGHWASSYISTAAAYGIVTGYDEYTFAPDNQITREQIAAMVVRAKNLSTATAATEFIDSYDISPWAESAVATAAAYGIIGGYPDNSFQPLNNATRAEAATMIVRTLDATQSTSSSASADADADADADDESGV